MEFCLVRFRMVPNHGVSVSLMKFNDLVHLIILAQKEMSSDYTTSYGVLLQWLGAQALTIIIVICGVSSTSLYANYNICHFDHSKVICIYISSFILRFFGSIKKIQICGFIEFSNPIRHMKFLMMLSTCLNNTSFM